MSASKLSPMALAINGFASKDASIRTADVINAFNAARAASKDESASLFSALLTLVSSGSDAHSVALFASKVRQAVREELRESQGFPRIKAKGSKESGAPDYSTASVYGKVIADCLFYRSDIGEDTFNILINDVADATDVPALLHECGLFETVSANKRLVAECVNYVNQRTITRNPEFHKELTVSDVALLEQENANLRAQLADMVKAGDPKGSLKAARAERDQAMGSLTMRENEVRALSAALKLVTEQRDALANYVNAND